MDEHEDRNKLIIFLTIMVGFLLVMIISSLYAQSKIYDIVQNSNTSFANTQLIQALATLWIDALISIPVDLIFILKRNLFNIVSEFDNEIIN